MNTSAVSQDTPITIKVSLNDTVRKLKLPLRDLGPSVLPDKLRQCLAIKPGQTAIFERFSDSAGGYITLDPNNPQVFKTLVRAAKAKLKLRLKATVSPSSPPEEESHPIGMEKNNGLPQAVEPIIVRSPVNARDSTALDRRSVGSGIFQFREARASQQTLIDTEDAPTPFAFPAGTPEIYRTLRPDGTPRDALAFRDREQVTTAVNTNGRPWSVYCNECDASMDDAHFHCSICDGGDYDLCEACVDSGKSCSGEGHWLIKRFIKDGLVVSSSTARISPRKTTKVEPEMPGAFANDTKPITDELRSPTRTCNSCVVVLPESEFVTCTSCEDFDLCIKCHTDNKHGHHPAHGFAPAVEHTLLPLPAQAMLSPGRNVRHNAICDGCDEKIYGVRHKCLNCPDWDYCGECVKDSRHSHPRHRFAAIYQPIADQHPSLVRHFGIFCDGPLCNDKTKQSYITGVRYKCAVCHDTDFCASCEAFPANHHNRTHPLIKFKTPVRNVSITTENEDLRGNIRTMGDRRAEASQTATKSTATETIPVQQANAATQVQTMAEIKPVEAKNEETQPVPVVKSEKKSVAPLTTIPPSADIPLALLNAHFVRDSVPDGQVVQPGARFTQIWTISNPGPYAWPAGCSVRYIGGDNMLNVDNSHPAAVTDLRDAMESNVVGRDVQVGEEVAFKVVLKAPTREGKSISYWRVLAANGTPFGHRLWCDIEVKAPAAQVGPASQPAAEASFDPSQQAQAFRTLQQQQFAHQQQLMAQQMQKQKQEAAALNCHYGQPPAYESTDNLSTRLAAMHFAQQRRRQQMVAQFNAQQRDHLQAQGIKREDMPSFKQHINPAMGGQQTAGPSRTEEEKARKEAAKQRVEHIKAKILKTREERAKALDAKQTEQRATKVDPVPVAVQEVTEKIEKLRQIVEALPESDEMKKEDVERSQMVFPKLEKESPASSTYQSATSSSSKGKAAYVENEQGEVEHSATPAATAPTALTVSSPADDGFEDLTDDIEVLSADAAESDDDGFLTDEEYDILDASDNETIASK